VGGGDDEAVFVVGKRHDLVHLLDHPARQANPRGNHLVAHAVDGLGPHVGAHRQHAFARGGHRLFVARRGHVGEDAPFRTLLWLELA